MKKTFDQICADILGETLMTPTKPNQNQQTNQPQQGQQQNQQNQQNQQGQQPVANHDEFIKNLITNLADKNFVAKVNQNPDLQKALLALQQNTQR